MAEVVATFKAICAIAKGVKAIKDLYDNDAKSNIGFAEMKSLVAGQHAEFFKVITLAEVTHARDSFYTAVLPSITSTSNIAARDVKTGGRLYREFSDLMKHRDDVASNLKKLAAVVEQYANDLHPDDLMSALIAFVNGYGLLFHIHATYSELHRIEIGASSLDHRDLKYDTLKALQYVKDASDVLTIRWARFNLFGEIGESRCKLVGEIRSVYVPGDSTRYYFKDTYTPLSTTPDHLYLSTPRYVEVAASLYRPSLEKARETYVRRIRSASEKLALPFNFRPELKSQAEVLEARALKQGVRSEELGSGHMDMTLEDSMKVFFMNLNVTDSSQISSKVALDSEVGETAPEKIEPEKIELDEEGKLDDKKVAKLDAGEFARLEAVTVELAAVNPEPAIVKPADPVAEGCQGHSF